MMMRRALSVCVVVAAAALWPAHGPAHAQESRLAVDVVSVEDVGYPALRAVVTVARDGAALPGLDTRSFAATLAGQPLPVTGVTEAVRDVSGADVALVVDVSGSMGGAPIAQAKAAAREFIAALAPADRVAVIAFSDDVRVLLDYTSDRAAALAAVNALEAVGDTALYQAAADAAHRAAQSSATRRAVLLLSDGLDYGGRSRIGRQESLTEAMKSGVPFYVIGLGNQIDRSYLEYLAVATSGRFLEAPTPQDLAGLYRAIAAELQSQYVLELDATGMPLAERSELTVTVTRGAEQASDTIVLDPRFAPVDLSVTLEGVAEGQEVRPGDAFTIVATPQDAVIGVTVRIDGVNVGELRTPPFRFAMPRLSEGSHDLLVEVRAIDGSIANAKATVVAAAPSAAGGGSPLPALAGLAVAALAALGGAGYIVLRRRASRPRPIEHRVKPWGDRMPNLEDWRSWEEDDTPVAVVTEPLGRLVALTGARAGQAYEIGARPVSIGSSPRCAVRLDASAETAPEEARVWVRNGRLVVHRVATLTAMALEGASGGWVILDPGDDIDLGGVRFRFELMQDAPAPVPPGEAPPATESGRPGHAVMPPAPAPPQTAVEDGAAEDDADEPGEPADSRDKPVSIFREGSRFARTAPEDGAPAESRAEEPEAEDDAGFDL
jgi:VWFA-related protein